jgi:hypothetical protein
MQRSSSAKQFTLVNESCWKGLTLNKTKPEDEESVDTSKYERIILPSTNLLAT